LLRIKLHALIRLGVSPPRLLTGVTGISLHVAMTSDFSVVALWASQHFVLRHFRLWKNDAVNVDIIWMHPIPALNKISLWRWRNIKRFFPTLFNRK
jgi:hypothetical protein